jgi:hypothetical protein
MTTRTVSHQLLTVDDVAERAVFDQDKGVATAATTTINNADKYNTWVWRQQTTIELNQPQPCPPQVSPDGLRIQLIKHERQAPELNICLLIFSGGIRLLFYATTNQGYYYKS